MERHHILKTGISYLSLEKKMNEMKHKWLFSATGHGKGPCDGIGGLVKHFASTQLTRYNAS